MLRRYSLGAIAIWLTLMWAVPRGFGDDLKLNESALDRKTKALLTKLRKDKAKTNLARRFESALARAQSRVERSRKGHVIVGRVSLDAGDPRTVQCQVLILEDGYFACPIGTPKEPVGFRLHGYEPVNVIPQGPGPIEHVGLVKLKRLTKERQASAKGTVRIEKHPDAPTLDQVRAAWEIVVDPLNTPDNSTDGYDPAFSLPPVMSSGDADGSIFVSGMSPAKYNVVISAKGCAAQSQQVELSEGKTKELAPIALEVARKINIEFLVSADGDFSKSKVQTTALTAGQFWEVSDYSKSKFGKYQIYMGTRQKQGKLLLGYAYGPITDLGVATLEEKRSAGPAQGNGSNQIDVPLESGHVFLINQGGWGQWILFRATSPKGIVAR